VKQTYIFYFSMKKDGFTEQVHSEELDFEDWSAAHLHFILKCKELNIAEDSIDSCFFHRKEDRYSASCFGGAHSLM